MKIREAFTYLIKNYKHLSENEESIIGVEYIPKASDGEFQIFSLGLDEDGLEEGNYFIAIHFSAGNIGAFDGVDDSFSGDYAEIEDIINEIPEVEQINFNIYPLECAPFGVISEYALKEIYPKLPNPDNETDFDIPKFRKEAIDLIKQVNKPQLYH